MYRKILVPLDGSELAEKVLPHVETLAQCTGAEILLMRVTVYPYEGGVAAASLTGFMPMVLPEVRQDLAKEATEYLNKVGAELRGRGLKVSTVVEDGIVGEAIAEAARTQGADLIAMCTHGRTGLGRAVFGSVAEAVLREAGKPLLLIRPLPQR